MTPEVDILNRRLDRLERENKRWRIVGLAGLAAAALLVLTGVTVKEPMIGAEAFTLLGKQGELRAVFAMVKDEPTLALFDSGGRVRAGLSLLQNSPQLILYGEDGKPVWKAP
jgi:hypothetical protein